MDVRCSIFLPYCLARRAMATRSRFTSYFPAFSIGLASYLAVLEALLAGGTGREVFINLFNYWLKIFAVAFAWAWCRASDVLPVRHQLVGVFRQAGPVIGPLMAYEV